MNYILVGCPCFHESSRFNNPGLIRANSWIHCFSALSTTVTSWFKPHLIIIQIIILSNSGKITVNFRRISSGFWRHIWTILKYGKPNVAIFNSFNFISIFVLCIQLCVQYSTCVQHSTRYSIFNFPFNIQLFILYSILHSPIQLSIQQFPLFIQHSTLIFKTFNCSFNIQLFVSIGHLH